MRKYAALEVLEAWRQPPAGVRAGSLARLAHRVAFDYAPREGYLYVRSRMISSRTNDNHDTFPGEEIEKGYRTFLGKPVFVNHHNTNHRRARGVIVAVALHRDQNPDKTPDTWVEGLMEVDAVKFPRLAKAILAKRVNRTSMGVDVEWSTCSACGNKATSPAEYCKHLPAMKGKKIRQRNKVTGQVEEKLIHEVCAGLSFFENSLLVEDPADPSAFVLGEPDARGLKGLNMSPRSASADARNRHGGHSVPPGDVRQSELSPARTAAAGRYQGQQFVFDDPDVGVGEFDNRVAYSRQAAPLGHHVSRVDRVSSQEPVVQVHADPEIARVADHQLRRNRAAQQLPAVAMGPDTRAPRVRKGEARVAAVERPFRPRVAPSEPWTEIDRRKVAVHLSDRADELSAHLRPADHGIYSTASAQDLRSFDQLQPHEQASVAHYHPQMVEEGNAPAGSTPHDYLYEPRQEPKNDFLGRYMDADDEFKSQYGPGDWEAHHAETLATHPIPRYPQENRWPLVVSDANPNYVDDGYHRLHSYMRDGATEVPTVRMHPKTAAVSWDDDEPDFHDHLGNTCRGCGGPVQYKPRTGSWRHDGSFRHDEDHQAVPVDPHDHSKSMLPSAFGGTHCLVCGEQAKINLKALDVNGGWHHHDGMKRDHLAVPSDPRKVYDSIPGVRAQFDQARNQVQDHMHGLFDQLEGGPVARKPRGDEHLMPPDPFTASRRGAAFMTDHPDRCANCGTRFGSMYADSATGSWPHQSLPFLCNDCALGHLGTGTSAGKPAAVRPLDKGGTQHHPVASESMDYPEDYEGGGTRRWEPGDAVRQSTSARVPKPARGRHPKPVRGYGRDPRFNGVALKKDKNGFYVHTHRSRSDSYPTVDDIPDDEIEQIRATGALQLDAAKIPGGEHPWFKDHPVSSDHIVSAYHETIPDEKALGSRWYSDAHHIAKAIGKGDAALGAGLLSAYSPQTAWPVNMFNASRAAQGDPPGPGSGAMGQQQKSAIRILGGEHHSDVLKAPKTSAFAHLIEHGGDSSEDEAAGKSRVVIDRHALSVAHGRRLFKEESGKAPLGQSQHYEHVEQLYRDAARDISKATGRKVPPHEVQAATWLGQIRKNQAEDSSGSRGGGGKGRVQMHNNSQVRWVEHHHQHHPDQIGPENMHYHGSLEQDGIRRLAYGETRVPPQVDTLRMDECPVCGEHNVWSGSRCPVCGFVVPPSVFRDPDTSKAGDVRDQLDSSGDVTLPPDAAGAAQSDGQPAMAQPAMAQPPMGSGEDADDQLVHPDQIAPDGVPTVQGGDPGATDGLPPEDQDAASGMEDPDAVEQDGEEQNLAGEGDVPPEDSAGEPEDQPGDDLICPACGTSFETDAAAQPGVPCPACGMASLHLMDEEDPGDPQKGQEEDPSGDGEEEPGAEAEEDEEEDKDMPASKTAAALAQAQARRIAELSARNEVLHAQLSFLASAAGVGRELAEIDRRVMQKHADILNPASPVPDPPEAPATETTEQALMPEANDNAGRPGTTPGANSRVPAQQTTTAITPGVEMQTPPATNLVDVTAPVQGTNPSQDGGVPLSQRRVETDVRVNPDPLAAHGPGIGGQGDNGAAFPWILDARGDGQKAGQGTRAAALHGGSHLDPPDESNASRRTFASIRLAKMRVQAGLAQGDELAVAERIEKDAALPTQLIEHEIGILSQMPLAQQRAAARPVQRTAARAVPSLASVGASAQYAPAVMDDLDASDLFD